MKPRPLLHAKPATVAWAVLIRELVAGSCTVAELVHETGLRKETVMGYMRALKRQKAVHVAQWVEDTAGRRRVASYALGDKPDAARVRKSRALIKRECRAKTPVRALATAWIA